MDPAGKVALVSGGASGLGAATVRALVARGARVAILDRARDTGEALARELGAAHTLFVPADVTDDAGMVAAVAAARSAFGAVHIAVGCAGIGFAGKVVSQGAPMPLSNFAMTVQINLVGMFNFVRCAAAAMAENPPDDGGERGAIVMTASIAAFDGQIGQAAYTASKAGVAGMTLPIARELARHGIRINTIAPGTFDTPMLAQLPEPARVALGQMVPFPNRLGRPAEFAALALHMVDNAMLNGETVRLDGALRMAPK